MLVLAKPQPLLTCSQRYGRVWFETWTLMARRPYGPPARFGRTMIKAPPPRWLPLSILL